MTPSERRAGPGVGGIVVCVLLFSGLCWSLHEYHFVNESLIWKKAITYCTKHFTALAAFHDMTDMLRLKEAVGGGFQGKVWIGLRVRSSSWQWSISDTSVNSSSDYKFSMWHPGEPNNSRSSGRLCVASRKGTWFDLDCDSKLPFVCYDQNLRNSSFGFVLVDQEKSWWGAENYCNTNHTNLASVSSEPENSEIQSLVGDDRFVWIGLFRTIWTLWASGDNKFENWLTGRPKKKSVSCVTSVFDVDHDGEWVETGCRVKYPFVCHKTLNPPPEKKKVLSIKITVPKSTIDLNDPAVTEALLDQIEEKIGEVGINKDLRVSWIKRSDGKIFNKEEKVKN